MQAAVFSGLLLTAHALWTITVMSQGEKVSPIITETLQVRGNFESVEVSAGDKSSISLPAVHVIGQSKREKLFRRLAFLKSSSQVKQQATTLSWIREAVVGRVVSRFEALRF